MSLSDEQKQRLSAVAKGRSRDSKGRLLPATTAQEARIAELEAQVTRLETSNQRNAAENVRLAEALRLAEQGRDTALENFRVEQAAAVRHARGVIRLGEENGALREELQHVNLKLDNRKEDIDAMEFALDVVERRYELLKRQRTIELSILVLVAIAAPVMAWLLVSGGAR